MVILKIIACGFFSIQIWQSEVYSREFSPKSDQPITKNLQSYGLIEVSKRIGRKIPELQYLLYVEDVYEIKRIILQNIYAYFSDLLKEVKKDKAIYKFADCLKPNDVVISFNWDLNLEKALRDLKKGYVYSLHDSKSNKITILKPHGSMNWFKQKEIKLKRVKPLIEGYDNINVDVFKYLRKPNTLKTDYIPYIVPPIIQKKIEPELEIIWKDFHYSLLYAQEINVLGYSLPSNDLYPRYVFTMAIWKNKYFQTAKRVNRQFLVANPDDSVYLTYRNLVGDPIQFEQAKFEELKFDRLFT